MIYGSVCSGIEAATVAWAPLAWEAAWFSEIDAFPSAVLAHHYPETPNLGDMKKIHKRAEFERAINLLVGGTPCQSFSVAGLRKGLDDPRGNLTLVYLAIARRARPRWLVWENVPGVLSDDGGRTFGTFLRALGELGYGFAYRCLDAQYFDLAQRRSRVFVVAHIGNWRRAAAVLFERSSLSGNPPPSRETGEKVTGPLESRAPSRGGFGTDFAVDGGLQVARPLTTGGGQRLDPETETFVTHTHTHTQPEGFDRTTKGTRGSRTTPTLSTGLPSACTAHRTPTSRWNARERSDETEGERRAFSIRGR